jgi:hypothetical protein
MISERDVWRAAVAMVRRYGGNARVESAVRVVALNQDGDLQGSAAWHRVMVAIERLQASRPSPGETIQ